MNTDGIGDGNKHPCAACENFANLTPACQKRPAACTILPSVMLRTLVALKPHTLRVWEHRHGLCICKRKESQHRYYDNEDLKYILRIAYLYHHGYRISQIAALSSSEISQLAAQKFDHDEYEVLVNQLLESGMDYNQLSFETTLDNAKKSMGIEKSIERVIYPFFDRIGLLWITGHIMPAQEHFCSHLVQKLIVSATEELPAVYKGKHRVLLFTPEKEMHDLSILFAQYSFKKKGIRTVMLGKNCSLDMLQYCCNHQPVTHLYFHFVTNFTNYDTMTYIGNLSAQFPRLQIIASGSALKDVHPLPANMQLLRSVKDLIAFELPA